MDFNNLNYFIGEAISKQNGEIFTYSHFTNRMLESLFSLTINSLTSIEDISSLKNLKRLNIIGQSPKEYSEDIIIDYEKIKTLKNLETLVIINNYHIQELDLNELENLKTLIVVANQNLKIINGLDKLKNLNHVVIVGSSIQNKDWLKEYILNTQKTAVNILDCRMYKFIAQDEELQKILYMMNAEHETNLLFAEKIGVGEIFSYTYPMINKIYHLGQDIIKNNIREQMSEEEKVRILYNYVVDSLEYDTEELQKRDDLILKDESIIKIYKNDYKFINSSYRALIERKVICEGYVNVLIYLLDLIGIEARNVYCNIKSNNIDYYNHSAIKIKINNDWYYCDPQLENKNQKNEFFMKSYEEFIKTHGVLVTTELNGKQKKR